MNETPCRSILNYLRNQLDENDRIAFQQHLVHCPTCNEEIKVLKKKERETGQGRKVVVPPSGMMKRVFHNIHKGKNL